MIFTKGMDKMIIGVTLAIFTLGVLIFSKQGTTSSNSLNNLNLAISPSQKIAFPTSNPSPSINASLSASPSISQTESAEKQASKAIIKTSKGNITLEFYSKDAPNTVRNFINKAKNGFYNNLTFHRVEDWVIQGGDPLGNGTGGGDMPTELNNKPFVVGSLGIARGQDIRISNDAQFFINKKDASWLNNQYTNFGIVTNGMDVVNKIQINDKILEIIIE